MRNLCDSLHSRNRSGRPAVKASLAIIVALSLAGTSLSAVAQEAEETAIVETVIAALEDGDTAAASRLITAVEGIGMGEQLFSLPADAVAALSGCEADAQEGVPMDGRYLFLYEWDCGRRTYSGGIGANDNRLSVRLAHIEEGREAPETLRRIIGMAPPPPIRIRASTPEGQTEADRIGRKHERRLDMISLRKGERFAQLLVDGDIDTLAASFNEYSTAQYGFRPPDFDETFVEMSGTDSDALRAQIEHIYRALGRPTGYSCEIGERETECTWEFANPEYHLMATLNGCCTDRWQIGRIRFDYSTPERLAEFGLAED